MSNNTINDLLKGIMQKRSNQLRIQNDPQVRLMIQQEEDEAEARRKTLKDDAFLRANYVPIDVRIERQQQQQGIENIIKNIKTMNAKKELPIYQIENLQSFINRNPDLPDKLKRQVVDTINNINVRQVVGPASDKKKVFDGIKNINMRLFTTTKAQRDAVLEQLPSDMRGLKAVQIRNALRQAGITKTPQGQNVSQLTKVDDAVNALQDVLNPPEAVQQQQRDDPQPDRPEPDNPQPPPEPRPKPPPTPQEALSPELQEQIEALERVANANPSSSRKAPKKTELASILRQSNVKGVKGRSKVDFIKSAQKKLSELKQKAQEQEASQSSGQEEEGENASRNLSGQFSKVSPAPVPPSGFLQASPEPQGQSPEQEQGQSPEQQQSTFGSLGQSVMDGISYLTGKTGSQPQAPPAGQDRGKGEAMAVDEDGEPITDEFGRQLTEVQFRQRQAQAERDEAQRQQEEKERQARERRGAPDEEPRDGEAVEPAQQAQPAEPAQEPAEPQEPQKTDDEIAKSIGQSINAKGNKNEILSQLKARGINPTDASPTINTLKYIIRRLKAGVLQPNLSTDAVRSLVARANTEGRATRSDRTLAKSRLNDTGYELSGKPQWTYSPPAQGFGNKDPYNMLMKAINLIIDQKIKTQNRGGSCGCGKHKGGQIEQEYFNIAGGKGNHNVKDKVKQILYQHFEKLRLLK